MRACGAEAWPQVRASGAEACVPSASASASLLLLADESVSAGAKGQSCQLAGLIRAVLNQGGAPAPHSPASALAAVPTATSVAAPTAVPTATHVSAFTAAPVAASVAVSVASIAAPAAASVAAAAAASVAAATAASVAAASGVAAYHQFCRHSPG